MSEEKIMRQFNNAVDSLFNQFNSEIYNRIKLKDPSCPFHLEVFRRSRLKGEEVFKFRVTLDKITEEDKDLCQDYIMPQKVYTKYIACKTGRRKWIFEEIL